MKDVGFRVSAKYILPCTIACIIGFRMLSYGVFELDTLYECFLCAIYGIWGVSVWYRITEDYCKKSFLELSGMMMLWELIRIVKYHHLTNPVAVRLAWYGFYIPMIMMAVRSFLLSQALLHEKNGGKAIGKHRWVQVVALTLILLVLTNEMHHLVFAFPNGAESGNLEYTYGIGYLAIVCFIIMMVVFGLVTLIRKCSLPESRRFLYLPLMLVGISVVCLILYVLGIPFKILGINLFTLPDIICLLQIMIWESCIFIGLIPANDGYYDIFLASSIGAKISDAHGNVVLCQSPAVNQINENIVENSEPIMGGVLSFSKDYTLINRLREELLEAREIIAGENLLIEEENKLLADKARYQERNKVYDEIAECVRSRTVMVEKLLEADASEDSFEERLAKACFVNAYIKRRSNLILQSKQDSEQYIMELSMALTESINYLALSGVNGYVNTFRGEDKLPVAFIFEAYDFFQDVVECVMDSLTAVMVDIRCQKGEVTLRIVMDTTKADALIPVIEHYHNAELLRDDDGTIALIRFKKEVR